MKHMLAFLFLTMSIGLSAQAVQQEAVGFIDFSRGRVLALAEKFSEEQFNWRPAEGVRSVGEVLLHIAGGNYYFMVSSGAAAPEGIDLQNIEKAVKGKANIVQTLTASYDALTEHISNISDSQFGDKVELPWPGVHSKLTIIFLGVDHTSEHLGQLIAYARMNGITPPWSEGQD